MSKSKSSESGDILRRLGTSRVLKFCHLSNYHLWLYPEPANGLPSNTVCITHDGGVAILGVFGWNLYQLVQGWRWQSRTWSPPISFQEDLQEAEVIDNFQLYALFSAMAFTPRPCFPGSYFQLMCEHSRDSWAGHSCPMWDLQMGTLWLETLHCPAKTFSSCTTVRSYSSLGLLLPTLLAQVSDLWYESKPPPAYSWVLHFILCCISLNLSLAYLIPFWYLCLRRLELT